MCHFLGILILGVRNVFCARHARSGSADPVRLDIQAGAEALTFGLNLIKAKNPKKTQGCRRGSACEPICRIDMMVVAYQDQERHGEHSETGRIVDGGS